MALSNNQLWERIKGLRGETVYTCTTGKPNKIIRVTDNRIEIEGRKTRIYRREVLRVYETLLKDGEISGARGAAANLRGWYVIMPVLQKAYPDKIEKIKGGIKWRE